MPPDSVQTITAYVAIAVPVTVAVANFSRVALEWLKQRHTIRTAHIEQGHKITTHYLDRALDPSVPLAIRHQLLRFLAIPDKDGSRLSDWASSELKRVGGIVDETNRAVHAAEDEIQRAKTATEVANAERKLADAVRRQQSLLDPPIAPAVTAPAIRAGFIQAKILNGLSMRETDLSDAELNYRELRGADFEASKLSNCRFQGSDLRAASFARSNLTNAGFYLADLRGANFKEANATRVDFRQARLEGADLSGASLDGANLKVTYDGATKWPEGFDPEAAGAVLVTVHPDDKPTP